MYDPISQHGKYQASVLTSTELLLLLVEVPDWCSNHHIVNQSILRNLPPMEDSCTVRYII
uniref:Uncharacterized protein n=1 Tax=Triticum urartu TaxID=4572 RepID=A0A8R7K6B5_TRIUA